MLFGDDLARRWYRADRNLRTESEKNVTENAAQLKKLLEVIFADEIVEPKERDALSQLTQAMSPEETSQVFQRFLADKWGAAIADDVLTSSEMRLLGHIMSELNLELKDLPEQARFALKDAI